MPTSAWCVPIGSHRDAADPLAWSFRLNTPVQPSARPAGKRDATRNPRPERSNRPHSEYGSRVSGVIARRFGILALIAVLQFTALLLFVSWEVVSQHDLRFEVWVEVRGLSGRIP
jgi:hypothetical protein